MYFSLVQQSKHLNESLASLSFLGLSFVSDESDWLSDVLGFLLKIMSASTRSSMFKIFFKFWAKAIPYDSINGERIRKLMKIPLKSFPNDLSIQHLITFNQAVVKSSAADTYLSFYNSLITSDLNQEVAVCLFASAIPLIQFASEETREEFQSRFEKFILDADPLLVPLYNSIIQSNLE
jgi:hypothetical protein